MGLKKDFVHILTMGGQDNVVEIENDGIQNEGVNVSGWTVRRVFK